MKQSETATLLAFIAAFDRRTIGAADVEAWHSLPFIRQVPYELAKQAVIQFFNAEPPDRGQAPYLDPQELRKYVRLARDHAEVEEARERARRPKLTAPEGTYAPPEDFRQKIADAVKNFGRMP